MRAPIFRKPRRKAYAAFPRWTRRPPCRILRGNARTYDCAGMIALDFTRPPSSLLVEPLVRRALEEDFGRAGDITSDLTIAADTHAVARLACRKPGVLSGLIAAEAAFRLVDSSLKFEVSAPDGSKIESRDILATVSGPARAILGAERVALNFAGHLSGVATATAALVATVAGTGARIVCTRKTLPGLRSLQ